jgi:hypothetical protein
MAKITVLFGVLLIILGAASFILTGHKAFTSLIPAGVGVLLIVFGALAETPETRRRMLFMHIAVTVGLLCFLFTSPALFDAWQLFKATKLFLHPAAVKEKAAMSVLLLIYVALCVRSFIAARRSRV